MKKNKLIIILIGLGLVIILLGIILINKNTELKNNKIKIIDASYMCSEAREKFYEDDKYIYSFPCVKSTAMFVKFPDGKKVLIIKALEEKLVTIDELIDAGLEVIKTEK